MNFSRILQIFPEIFQFIPTIYIFLVFFFLSCRTEIFDPDNSESFPNYTQIITESQTFDLTDLNPNNSFVYPETL